MAVKGSAQIDLIDLTDGYSVVLTSENNTFLGTASSVSGTQIVKTQAMALCGSEQVSCTIGKITTAAGISAVSDGKTPTPTITITATSALKSSGSFTIPVQIGDITINKVFSYSIAFKGGDGKNGTSVTITDTNVTYQISDSGTTAPTGTWASSVPTVPAGKFLWTRTVVKYSDGKSTTSYSISRSASDGSNGHDGTSVTVTSTTTTYQASASGTTAPTGTWLENPPTTKPGQFLWTKTVVKYSDGKSTTSYSISRNGTDGSDGSDAINMTISSSGGLIFKNTAIATTLTAHVYQGGKEVKGASLTALGTIRWYQDYDEEDEEAQPIATGSTLTISPGDVTNKASYTANLEG